MLSLNPSKQNNNPRRNVRETVNYPQTHVVEPNQILQASFPSSFSMSHAGNQAKKADSKQELSKSQHDKRSHWWNSRNWPTPVLEAVKETCEIFGTCSMVAALGLTLKIGPFGLWAGIPGLLSNFKAEDLGKELSRRKAEGIDVHYSPKTIKALNTAKTACIVGAITAGGATLATISANSPLLFIGGAILTGGIARVAQVFSEMIKESKA